MRGPARASPSCTVFFRADGQQVDEVAGMLLESQLRARLETLVGSSG